MRLRYLSVCSGIEAATVAWRPLGWSAMGFAEIDPFASAVLAHHYPEVKNHGDFTRLTRCEYAPGSIDVLVGGTPCQSFSVAGQRAGLDDPRGVLAMEFLRVAGRLHPRWVVWENVAGVLSSGGGRDFGSFLGALAECGYGFAYRVLNAQHFGVPQRRRRVFVVGHLGDWRPAAAVLLEPEGQRGDSAQGGEAREEEPRGGTAGVPEVSPGVARPVAGHAWRGDHLTETLVFDGVRGSEPRTFAPALRGLTGAKRNGGANLCVALNYTRTYSHDRVYSTDGAAPAVTSKHPRSFAHGNSIRRLTPRECERLQGFPDDYTLVPNFRSAVRKHEVSEFAAYYGITHEEARRLTPESRRYKAIGNSMAVPVVRWIGERIELVEHAMKELEENMKTKARAKAKRPAKRKKKRARMPRAEWNRLMKDLGLRLAAQVRAGKLKRAEAERIRKHDLAGTRLNDRKRRSRMREALNRGELPVYPYVIRYALRFELDMLSACRRLSFTEPFQRRMLDEFVASEEVMIAEILGPEAYHYCARCGRARRQHSNLQCPVRVPLAPYATFVPLAEEKP